MDLEHKVAVTVAHFLSIIGNQITVNCIKSYIRKKPLGLQTFLDAIMLDFLRIYEFFAVVSKVIILSGIWLHQYIDIKLAYI